MSEALTAACPGCGSLNRLPPERDPREALCGRCRAKLFQGVPLHLTSENFDLHAAGSGLPLVVDFWAPWCAPCRAMEDAFARAAAALEPRARLGKVNTDDEQRLAGRYGIQGIPTVILFRGGKERARRSGAVSYGELVAWVTGLL